MYRKKYIMPYQLLVAAVVVWGLASLPVMEVVWAAVGGLGAYFLFYTFFPIAGKLLGAVPLPGGLEVKKALGVFSNAVLVIGIASLLAVLALALTGQGTQSQCFLLLGMIGGTKRYRYEAKQAADS